MSDAALRVDGLGKAYRLGTGERGSGVRGALTAPFAHLRWMTRDSDEEQLIWALRDVSFEVNRGEVLGVIGRNGAGKSTLLKILSRITEPTTGQAAVSGRVGSLLEVGTGFHPELTGRENIYLNGAILGMSREHIERRFDEMVSFAGVERFLDTPVKRYSSGMYVRLAFAVASHLSSDILVIDEVLAVGDLSFQKRCLGKMHDVARQGRTVIFVSHQLASVQALCDRALLLEEGSICVSGEVQEVVASYVAMSEHASDHQSIRERTDRGGDGSVRICDVRVEAVETGAAISSGSRLRFVLSYEADRVVRGLSAIIGVYNDYNVGIMRLDSEMTGGIPDHLPAHGELVCETQPINLTPGRCKVNVAFLHRAQLADHLADAASFHVEAADILGNGKLPTRDLSIIVVPHEWGCR